MQPYTTPLFEAVSGHVDILIVMLSVLGAMIAAVGFAGLAAAQGGHRTPQEREFAIRYITPPIGSRNNRVLRAIGSRNNQVLATLLIEGALYWAFALALAVALCLPFSMLFNSVIGQMTFGLPLPFSFDWQVFGLWAAISLGCSLLASLPPGLAATRSSVTTSLNQL